MHLMYWDASKGPQELGCKQRPTDHEPTSGQHDKLQQAYNIEYDLKKTLSRAFTIMFVSRNL